MPNELKVAVVSHGNKENLFFEMWSKYYGKLFGFENLFFVYQNEDWTPPELPEPINTECGFFPAARSRFDGFVADYMNSKCAELLNRYDIVIRSDIDEFLFVDPLKGSWNDVFDEARKYGFVNALGFDVVHNVNDEADIDLTKKILSQRSTIRVSGPYCKPHVIARPVQWNGACHRIVGESMKMSSSLCMAHLALFDDVLYRQRLEERGDLSKSSWRPHVDSRRNRIKQTSDTTAINSYELFDGLRTGIPEFTARKGNEKIMVPFQCNGVPRNGPRCFILKLPEHFSEIL